MFRWSDDLCALERLVTDFVVRFKVDLFRVRSVAFGLGEKILSLTYFLAVVVD